MDVLHVVVPASIDVQKVAAQIVALVHDRQELVGLMKGLVLRDEIWEDYKIDNLYLGSIHPDHFLDIVATARSYFRNGLNPKGKYNVCLLLNFKEALGMLAVPEEIIKDFIAVVKRRLYRNLPNVVVWVEFIEKLLTLTDILSEIP